jgi:hypothetical protein
MASDHFLGQVRPTPECAQGLDKGQLPFETPMANRPAIETILSGTRLARTSPDGLGPLETFAAVGQGTTDQDIGIPGSTGTSFRMSSSSTLDQYGFEYRGECW